MPDVNYSDRFKLRMPELGVMNWDDEVNDNQLIFEVLLAAIVQGNGVVSGVAPSDGGGLQVDYAAGVVVVAGVQYSISAGNKACTDDVKNWLYVDNAGAMQISTSVPTGDYSPIALIDTASGAIVRIADLRPLGPQKESIKTDSGTTVTVSVDQLDTVIRLTAATPVTINLCSIDASHIGRTIEFLKRGAGTNTINRADADTVGGETTVTNSTAGTVDSIKLRIESATEWGLVRAIGPWNFTT